MSETNKVEKYCKIFVNVPFERKELAKSLWFKYDGDRKQWYIKVRSVKDVQYLQLICFLFEYIDIVGVNMSDENVVDIRVEYRGTSSELLRDEKYKEMKDRLYTASKKKKRVCCDNCFKVDEMDLIDGKCESCV